MPDLYARIDDQYVPLTDCAWALRASCGCIRGINVAASENYDRVYLTPADGLAVFADEDESVADLSRAGYRVDLMPAETALRGLAFRCEHEEEHSGA